MERRERWLKVTLPQSKSSLLKRDKEIIDAVNIWFSGRWNTFCPLLQTKEMDLKFSSLTQTWEVATVWRQARRRSVWTGVWLEWSDGDEAPRKTRLGMRIKVGTARSATFWSPRRCEIYWGSETVSCKNDTRNYNALRKKNVTAKWAVDSEIVELYLSSGMTAEKDIFCV